MVLAVLSNCRFRICKVYRSISNIYGMTDRLIGGVRYKSSQSSLLQQIKDRIKFSGPITVADYMKEVLTNPAAGYYMHKDVFGQRGDFITSPEISQMFGELIGVWCVNEWLRCGLPASLNIIELGPGRGTLSDDILRVCSQFEGVCNAVRLHLVEVSPKMIDLQRNLLTGSSLRHENKNKNVAENSDLKTQTHLSSDDNLNTSHSSHSHEYSRESTADKLSHRIENTTDCVDNVEGCTSRHGVPVCWYHQLKDVPHGFSFIIAHEFFDALPIHKFQKKDGRWREVLVDVVEDSSCEDQLRFVLSSSDTAASKLLLKNYGDLTEGVRDHVELCPQGAVLVEEVAHRVARDGGSSLIADYGHSGEKGDTFRGFRDHKLHPVLSSPGSADLTADVDFQFYKNIVKIIVKTHGPIAQAEFLQNMGIEVRLQMLLKRATHTQQRSLISGYKMLTDSAQMGQRFKFLSLLQPDTDPEYVPAGFTKLQ